MFSNFNYLSLALVTPCVMLESFACKETQLVYKGIASRKLPSEIQNVARRKLRMIHNALRIEDLKLKATSLRSLKGIGPVIIALGKSAVANCLQVGAK